MTFKDILTLPVSPLRPDVTMGQALCEDLNWNFKNGSKDRILVYGNFLLCFSIPDHEIAEDELMSYLSIPHMHFGCYGNKDGRIETFKDLELVHAQALGKLNLQSLRDGTASLQDTHPLRSA